MINKDNRDFITVSNARENNLKNINVKIPKNKFVVITGVSGSGKSSLAFDVIYNEGRRRYVDSLSNYARQFLGGTSKPDVDSIEGLSPAIAIDQKTTSNNPRSTVGTVTEIYDFYRLLYARIGIPYCPRHNIPITSQTITQIVDKIFEWKKDSKLEVLSPVVTDQKGTHKNLLTELKEKSFLRVKINGEILRLDSEINLDKNKKHNISILVDRVILNDENRSRIFEAIQTGLKYSDGLIVIENISENKSELFSTSFACKFGDFSMPKLSPRLFSFNNPQGACEVCHGLGYNQQVTWEKLVDEDKTILEGGIKYFGNTLSGYEWNTYNVLFEYYKIPLNKKISTFKEREKDLIMYGSKEPLTIKFKSNRHMVEKYDYIEGLATQIERRFLDTSSELARNYYHKFLGENICEKCHGAKLNEHALSVRIDGKNINELTKMSILNSFKWINELDITNREYEIIKLVVDEIKSRFNFLINVGLGYLTLDRLARTLSGGESQRIRLASQLGSKLSGVIYVLDEPSIGLHQRDNAKLIASLKEIRDLGNTVIVVEHDEETMQESDYIIDIGPEAGEFGGKVVATGTFKEIKEVHTHTGDFLAKRDIIEIPKEHRKTTGRELQIINARENNLKNIDVTIPLNKFVVITGVSGSGKSTLINEILYKVIHNEISRSENYETPGKCDEIKGTMNIDKIVKISQDPIGKTPRSNPATYTSVFDDIRDVFADATESKIRGYLKGRFSFNVSGGRCDKCMGDGILKISMHFLPDVYIKCDQCNGKRYNEETLQIKYKNKTISDVLEMSVREAITFFTNRVKIRRKLELLEEVGLGYIRLGHPSTLLSGGEAQRVKLATHLQKRPTGKTLFILDEPTTGLHHYDIKKLLEVLNKIVDNGDSIIVIEHNLDVIKVADHIIDLGPEGGEAGGRIIASGTPQVIASSKSSVTGKFLKNYL
ncbi:MAG: UvrABC system protein A [Candidatus Hepatoplasma vulgare]|nr:MAG: UvrABC system protein A [Candidatus Hepatoplasma sp.]